ncbi:hypothetical protein E0H54_26430 [Rhizobium leguminosarum bv. viciae]|nr:hypothetical protein E0H54_26430 [Rhizobium leguminosarum bv. viciae]
MSRLAHIPVLVTGIQPPRVCAAKESFHPMDLGWLDLCAELRVLIAPTFPTPAPPTSPTD